MDSVQDDPQGAGFPHSEIRGSMLARNSPRLIAACYVLHRLSVPRHPPNALQRLIAKLSCAGTSPAQLVPQAANRRTIRPAEGGGQIAAGDWRQNTTSSQCQRANNLSVAFRYRTSDIEIFFFRSLELWVDRRVSGSLCTRSQGGGGERIRTVDLLVANQALSQLSYTPGSEAKLLNWWAWVDLNYRPHAYQACALTN